MSSQYRNLTRNILKHYRASTDATREVGGTWYDGAFTECEVRGWRNGVSLTRSVIALAHLSPRITWAANLNALDALLAGQPKPGQTLTRSWERGLAALTADDPWSTFGASAFKTRSFAKAILGDPNAVVIDVWALRVAGAPEDWPKSQGAHNMLTDAYRRAARIESITAREIQAITWVHLRGNAA